MTDGQDMGAVNNSHPVAALQSAPPSGVQIMDLQQTASADKSPTRPATNMPESASYLRGQISSQFRGHGAARESEQASTRSALSKSLSARITAAWRWGRGPGEAPSHADDAGLKTTDGMPEAGQLVQVEGRAQGVAFSHCWLLLSYPWSVYSVHILNKFVLSFSRKTAHGLQ